MLSTTAGQLTGFLVFPTNTRKSRRICPLDLVRARNSELPDRPRPRAGDWLRRCTRVLHDDTINIAVQPILIVQRLRKYLIYFGHPTLNWVAFVPGCLPLFLGP